MIVAVVAVVAVVVVVVLVGATAAARNRRPTDDIASFRRQIDALSPEARRQTSDRMNPSEPRSTDDDGADEI
jgi:type II secretory pathway pseudopilin PulG